MGRIEDRGIEIHDKTPPEETKGASQGMEVKDDNPFGRGGEATSLFQSLEACLHDPNDKDWKGCDACEATFEIIDSGSRWPAPTDFTQEGKQLPAPGTAKKAAETSLIPPDSLIPDYKNLQYKHNLLLKKVKSEKFDSKDICKCLGCCKGDCYFPVDSSTLDPWA